MEDFEKNFKVGDEIEGTLSDKTYFSGKISSMFTTGENPASPEYSVFSIINLDSNVPLENIRFFDVEDCRMIKKGYRD